MSFKPYVEIIPPGEATGELKRVYDKIKQTRGMIAPVQTVFSLRPDIMGKMSELGAIAHFQDGFLSRRQHELIRPFGIGIEIGIDTDARRDGSAA